MAQSEFGDFDVTASNNTSITGDAAAIDIAEGWAAANINNAIRAVMSAAKLSFGDLPSGTARPSDLTAGKDWVDTTTATAPIRKHYDGTDDITVYTFDYSANTVTFNGVASGGLANIVEDTTPQLGGDLDVNGQQITSASNGNIVIDPHGTGVIHVGADVFFEDDTDSGFNYVGDGNFTLDIAGAAVVDLAAAAATFKKQAKSTVKTLTSATSITVTMTDENVQFVTLDHNATFTISGDAEGQWMTLIIKQGLTGGTGAWSGVDVWMNGGSAPTLSTTTGEYDIVNLFVIAGPIVIASHVGP